MTTRTAAGLEPMHPTIRLHGCHRVGNQITGIDPASPEAQRTFYLEVAPLPVGWVEQMYLVACARDDIRKALFADWY